MTESICKNCSNAESLGGKCREFQASDGHYTWGTPIFQDDDELERLVGYQGGTFNSGVANCGSFIQKQCEFAQQGAAGAYLAVYSDPTKPFEAPQWTA